MGLKKTKQIRAQCDCHSTTFDGWYGHKVRLFNEVEKGVYKCVVCERTMKHEDKGKSDV